MNVSSRTPEGEPNRCAVCGRIVCIEPSRPPGDAPCSFCGSLLWFTSASELDSNGTPSLQVRLRFHGGCRDGLIFARDPRSLSESHGYRYYQLAVRGRVGMSWHEVPLSEYGAIAEVLENYGPASRLCEEEIREIIQQLRHVRSDVYEITRREATHDEIAMHLQFVCRDVGI